ncbi:MAG: CPBP family intramembrane metalloprotease [bacterium]|nr:CPBP family intramembrane metalloprotease [bacterium]
MCSEQQEASTARPGETRWLNYIFFAYVMQMGIHFILVALLMLGYDKALPFTYSLYLAPGTIDIKVFEVPWLGNALDSFNTLLVSALIIAPVIEELAYRGLTWLAMRLTESATLRWFLIFSSSLIWSFAHHRTLIPTLDIFFIGLFLGWIVLKTRSILAAMMLHALWNFSVIFRAIIFGLP